TGDVRARPGPRRRPHHRRPAPRAVVPRVVRRARARRAVAERRRRLPATAVEPGDLRARAGVARPRVEPRARATCRRRDPRDRPARLRTRRRPVHGDAGPGPERPVRRRAPRRGDVARHDRGPRGRPRRPGPRRGPQPHRLRRARAPRPRTTAWGRGAFVPLRSVRYAREASARGIRAAEVTSVRRGGERGAFVPRDWGAVAQRVASAGIRALVVTLVRPG